ncbi:MAG TPA: hypothetical protein VFC42_11970 [Methylomirabilota bacterium]|nr:hypothetical protein [Methylomirabilota bacterium]
MRAAAAVVVRRGGYPQVEPRAAGLMDAGVTVVPATLTVGEAQRAAARRSAVVAARVGRSWAVADRETLGRARRLGLEDAPLGAVLWDAPAVAAGASEIDVRRRLGPAHPFVLVVDTGSPVGVVVRDPASRRALPLSARQRLMRLPAPLPGWLERAGALGDAARARVAVVGGLVRDLFRDRVAACVDVDLVVEGSAPAVARRLAGALGGRAVEHPAFLTATVELPDGRRLDLATARRERYRAPGALPDVEPATLADDLARRDFALNAVAIRLDADRWGEVVDVVDGLADLRARRLRVLHPLSFVEDPTRVFRAARFAARLGCTLERTTARLARHATALRVYDALSGDRLRAELLLALAEPDPVAVLVGTARLGAWRLVVPGARTDGRVVRRLATALRDRAGLAPETVLALAVLAVADGPAAAEAGAARLALSPGARAAVRRAGSAAPGIVAALRGVSSAGRAYASLAGTPELDAAWARVLAGGGRAARYLDRYLREWRALRPLATGADVGALGVPPGPAVGRLLRELLAAQAAGRVRRRPDALRWLRTAIGRKAAEPGAELTRSGQRGG